LPAELLLNIVLVILDSQWQDYLAAYGNDWIRTPNLDAFARESVRFTRCYHKSLPTLPVRRALHTGTRIFPFRGHRQYKGDFAGAAGWGPIDEKEETVAEMLQARRANRHRSWEVGPTQPMNIAERGKAFVQLKIADLSTRQELCRMLVERIRGSKSLQREVVA